MIVSKSIDSDGDGRLTLDATGRGSALAGCLRGELLARSLNKGQLKIQIPF